MAGRDSHDSTMTDDNTGKRKWSDEEMVRMMQEILKGRTYQDVTDGTHVPISTLWTRVKGRYDGEVRPRTGAPGIFPTELECELALFMKHCDLLRLPRTRAHLKEDIWTYVDYHELSFKKLEPEGPGRSWFERFAEKWKELVDFKTKGVIFRIENDPITMRNWTLERDYYTRIQHETKKFPGKEYIFVIEYASLEVKVENKVKLEARIMYNAEGTVLKPFFVHDGKIQNVVQRHFQDEMIFCQTQDGEFNEVALIGYFDALQRHLDAAGLFESPVVYLTPQVSKHLGFTLWDKCNKLNIILQTVPQNIFNYLRTSNMGIMDKLLPSFKDQITKKFPEGRGICLVYNLLEIFQLVMLASKWKSHLRNSCSRLRIVAVTRPIQISDDENEDDESDQVQGAEGQSLQVTHCTRDDSAQFQGSSSDGARMHEDLLQGSQMQAFFADEQNLPDI